MKKLLLLGFVCLFAGAVSAQSKSCCASKSAKSCTKSEAKAEASASYDEATLALAIKAASANEDIEKKVCEKSGKVSFMKKTVSADNEAEVQFIPVVYNADKGSFEPEIKSKQGCCSKDKAKSCQGSKAMNSSEKEADKEEATKEVKKAKV